MPVTSELYRDLIAHLRKTAMLGSCGSVLGWDEQTYMPSGGAEHRAEQLALLAGMTHELATAPRLGELIGELEQRSDLGAPGSPELINLKEARRNFDRATKLPQRLVEDLSRIATLGQQAWVEARRKSDFSLFEKHLEKMLGLKRAQAEALGYGDGQPYDALLDEYEPGATAASISAAFEPLRDELVPLVAAVRDAGRKPDVSILSRRYPVDAQREFSLAAARAIGFSFDKGRLDVAAHPFCSGFGPGDCRLTTRYDEQHFNGAFFGTLHEAGHGIYEQGLNGAAFGTAMGETVSLGIHESQSRMWENLVGRSRSFWEHFFPKAQTAFPEALRDVSLDQFHAAINDVRPSFIRVEADEVTYNLHIMLRFELEQAMLVGDLSAAEIPAAWNETFNRYFGMTPPDAARGCLQDIHWSAGLLGYFPTYALGNMYAAQFFATADRELGGLAGQFARGEFLPLKTWLNERIHSIGKRFPAGELVRQVTGQPLSHTSLMSHLNQRFRPLYGL